ncbi:MAG TPA: chlorite dismutase family protein [Candidatus Limnocylindrales bacterium]
MSDSGGTFIHALGLGLTAEWRRRSPTDRRADLDSFCEADAEAIGDGVRSLVYSSIGLEPGTDLLLWRSAQRVDALETAAARLLRSALGGWLTVTQSFLGRMGPSQYVVKPSDQESGLTGEARGRYVVVYPFTKSTDWYLQARETRQGVMNEHMRVGRSYPTVRQALAYSFGLDDQDFVVAYETDDLDAFADLVRELRGTDSRRSTIRDTPLLLGIARSFDEIAALLGAAA